MRTGTCERLPRHDQVQLDNTTAALPVNPPAFTAADGGTRTFAGGVTFKATGSFTVSANDTVKTTIRAPPRP